jgi:hypothetical protein
MIGTAKKGALWARMFCAIALLFLGFSAPLGAYAASGADGPAYLLPDGTYASLCIPDRDGGTSDHASHGCDHCTLTGCHAFLPTADLWTPASASRAVSIERRAFFPVLKRFLSAHTQSRAPPLNG